MQNATKTQIRRTVMSLQRAFGSQRGTAASAALSLGCAVVIAFGFGAGLAAQAGGVTKHVAENTHGLPSHVVGADSALPALLPPLLDAPAQVVEAGGYSLDTVVVQLARGVRVVEQPNGARVVRTASARRDGTLARALSRAGATAVEPFFTEGFSNPQLASRIGLDRWYRVRLAAGTDPRDAVRVLTALGGAAGGMIERAELDGAGGLAEIPNDTDFWVQYALRNTGQVVGGVAGTPGADIGMASAWDRTRGNPDLVIAVLDSGIDPHPEIAGRILPGRNVPDNTTITVDECNHGTHVAGILAATGNNASGMAGVTWNTKLLPVVVVNGCTGFESNVAIGLTWAVDQGARLVNMSLQFYGFGAPLQQAVQYAHGLGAIMCAATGNNGNSNVAAPALYNQTIAVASTDNRDIRASNSNFGPATDIAAPGVNVWSLSAGGSGYTLKSGTSMATPHVTGVAALIWSLNPSLTRDEVRQILLTTTVDLGDPGTDNFYGAGRLNAAAALAAVPPAGPPQDLDGDGSVGAADLSLLLAAWGACSDCDACPADFDGDCVVGAADLSLLLAEWGS